MIQLLRLTAHIGQTLTDLQDQEAKDFITLMQKIQSDECLLTNSVEGRSVADWEDVISKSWKSMIEKVQLQRSDFYSPRIEESKQVVAVSDTSKKVDAIVNDLFMKSASQFEKATNAVNDSEYVQMKNKYL